MRKFWDRPNTPADYFLMGMAAGMTPLTIFIWLLVLTR